jgi:hypothetical protein
MVGADGGMWLFGGATFPIPPNSWWCCGRQWWLCGAVPPVSPPTWVGVTGGDHRLRVWVFVPLLGRLLGV